MLMFALFFRTLSLGLEVSRLLLLSLLGPVSKSKRSAGASVATRRFYFDLRVGSFVIRDNVGACTSSTDDALADAVEVVEEFGKQGGEEIGADEIIVRDESGDEVGRIDLSRWRERSGL
jgi:hypothetical protein